MKRQRESSRHLLRPWLNDWQLWRIPAVSPAALVDAKPVPAAATADSDVVAVPARSVVSAAFWVPVPDSGEWREAAQLEVELRGLLPARNADQSVCLTKVEATDARTLVRAVVFPADLGAELSGLNFRHFEASPLLIPQPANAGTFWVEGNELVLCLTRGDTVVVWETLDATATPEEIRLWANLLVLQLQAEGVLSEITVWQDLTGTLAGIERILPGDGAFSAPGSSEPLLPATLSAWKPASAISVIQKADRTRQIQKILKLAALVYLALIAGALGYLGWMKFRLSSETSERNALQQEVEKFAPISEAWDAVATTVETSQFPLEILHKLVKNLPPSGIRLTLLNVADGSVLVEGEATTVSLPSGFLEALEADPEFQDVIWEMAPPSLLPNNTARFQMRGTLLTP